MNTVPQCQTCKFWNKGEEKGRGECRRNPPQAVIMPMPMAGDGEKVQQIQRINRPGAQAPHPVNQRFGPVSFWPPALALQWCGEHTREEA